MVEKKADRNLFQGLIEEACMGSSMFTMQCVLTGHIPAHWALMIVESFKMKDEHQVNKQSVKKRRYCVLAD